MYVCISREELTATLAMGGEVIEEGLGVGGDLEVHIYT
jgi:hypothetical protein